MSICDLPNEILEKIFLLSGYNSKLYNVCRRFNVILNEIDYYKMRKLDIFVSKYENIKNKKNLTGEEKKIVNKIRSVGGKYKFLNSNIKNCFIFNDIFNLGGINIIETAKILRNIENKEKYGIIRKIKEMYNIAFDDLDKIYNLIINKLICNYNSKKSYDTVELVKLCYDKLFYLSCFMYICMKDMNVIVSLILNNTTLNSDFIKFYEIINYNAKKFVEMDDKEYFFYHRKLMANSKAICKEKGVKSNSFIWHTKSIKYNTRYKDFYDMIINSKNIKIHLDLIKKHCYNLC